MSRQSFKFPIITLAALLIVLGVATTYAGNLQSASLPSCGASKIQGKAPIVCPTPTPSIVVDRGGAVNDEHTDRISVIPVDARGVIDIYLNYGVPTPVVILTVTRAELAALPPAASLTAPLLIAESDDGMTQMYLLPDGKFQVMYGPDFEGKIHVFVFNDLSSMGYTYSTFMDK